MICILCLILMVQMSTQLNFMSSVSHMKPDYESTHYYNVEPNIRPKPEDSTQRVFVQKVYMRPIFDIAQLRSKDYYQPADSKSEQTIVINNVLKRFKPAVFRFG